MVAVHEDLPGCPARKSGEEWQPVAKCRKEPSWFTKAPPERAGLFTDLFSFLHLLSQNAGGLATL